MCNCIKSSASWIIFDFKTIQIFNLVQTSRDSIWEKISSASKWIILRAEKNSGDHLGQTILTILQMTKLRPRHLVWHLKVTLWELDGAGSRNLYQLSFLYTHISFLIFHLADWLCSRHYHYIVLYKLHLYYKLFMDGNERCSNLISFFILLMIIN